MTTTMDEEFAAVTREFMSESGEILDRMEDATNALEERPSDMELIRSLFRGAHTLKGNAACLSLGNMSRAAHEMEDVMDLLRGARGVDAGGDATGHHRRMIEDHQTTPRIKSDSRTKGVSPRDRHASVDKRSRAVAEPQGGDSFFA